MTCVQITIYEINSKILRSSVVVVVAYRRKTIQDIEMCNKLKLESDMHTTSKLMRWRMASHLLACTSKVRTSISHKLKPHEKFTYPILSLLCCGCFWMETYKIDFVYQIVKLCCKGNQFMSRRRYWWLPLHTQSTYSWAAKFWY